MTTSLFIMPSSLRGLTCKSPDFRMTPKVNQSRLQTWVRPRGWLIPTYYAKEVWKIDPKTFWKYSEGATHAANEVAVSAGQVDMATDFDRNRNAMIAAGRVTEQSNKIVWTSDPLPNDAIALPADAPKERMTRVREILTAI